MSKYISREEELAIALHSKLCRLNHKNGCSWAYEKSKGQHDWVTGEVHKRYLSKAQKIIEATPGMTNAQLLAIVSALPYSKGRTG
jgi:hypothetical protein